MRTMVAGVLAAVVMLASAGSALAEESAAVRDWTFLVFVNADNNLDSAGVDDLAEMQKVGSDDRMNVVVQLDRWHGPANRYFVRKGAADVVASMGEVDMGDWHQLVEFARWGMATYPARRYALVVWNHGSGWDKRRGILDPRGISYDDTNDNHITTPQLESAVAEIAGIIGRPLDVLGFDACLMNMVEVAYQVRRSVGVIVGSEETEPGDGWPYDRLLGKLAASPTMDGAALGRVIVGEYAASYGVQATTQSCLKASALDDLRKAMDLFVAACTTAGQGVVEPAVAAAQAKVTRFYVAEYVDLFHWMDLFAAAVSDKGCRDAARAVTALEGRVVLASKVTGVPFMKKKARGISVYFPERLSYYSSYGKLAFSVDGQWDDFLRWNLGLALDEAAPGDRRVEMLER